jgi:hypothetical protein
MAGLESTHAYNALALGHYLDMPMEGLGDAGLKSVEEAHCSATLILTRKSQRTPSPANFDDLVTLWRGFLADIPKAAETAAYVTACRAHMRASIGGTLPPMEGARNFGGSVKRHLAALAGCCRFLVEAPRTRDLPRLWAAHCMSGQPFQRDALLMAMATRLPMPLSTRSGQVDNAHLCRSAAHLLNVSLEYLRQRHHAVVAAAKL